MLQISFQQERVFSSVNVCTRTNTYNYHLHIVKVIQKNGSAPNRHDGKILKLCSCILGWLISSVILDLKQRDKKSLFWDRGLYFGPKTIFVPPPPFWKWYFSPSRDTSFLDCHRGLFSLILPYLAFILPFYFPFSHFLSPFSFTFSPFFSSPFHIFSPKWHRLIFPPPLGGYFPIYRPLFWDVGCMAGVGGVSNLFGFGSTRGGVYCAHP